MIVAAVVYLVLATPKYTATTTLLIDTETAQLLKPREQGTASDPIILSDSSAVASQAEVVSSEGTARVVVQRMHLVHNAEFLANGQPGLLSRLSGFVVSLIPSSEIGRSPTEEDAETWAAQVLMSMTTVKRTGTTWIIDVSVKARSPTMAAQLANGIAEAYTSGGLEAKAAMARNASGWLEDRSRELLDQARVADRAVQQFKAQNNIVDTDKGLMNQGQLSDLSNQLSIARATLAQAKARYDQIQSILKQGVFDGDVMDALDNQVIIHLRQQYLDASRQAIEWSAKYGPSHISVVNIKNQMRELQNNIQSELMRISDSYRSNYEVALAGEQSLEQKLAQLSEDSAGTNEKLVTLRGLQSSADTFRTMYESFLERYTQAVQDQSFPIPEARVVTVAVPPLHKSSPPGAILLAAACTVGLMLGFGIAFVQDALDKTLRTGQQIPSMLGLDFIGFLPLVSARQQRLIGSSAPSTAAAGTERAISARHAILRYVTTDPFSPFAEIMRSVRLQIARKSAPDHEMKIIGCVSALPGEGKSTVAANLAQFLAKTGSKTLLLDWDLRKLTLSRSLVPSERSGFTEVVGLRTSLSEAIYSDPVTSLEFLPGGTHSALPEILSSDTSRALLAALRAKYEYVIVDLPAMAVAADAFAASEMIDGVLVVVEWGQTNKEVVVESLHRMRAHQTEILGVVLNKVNFSALKRYTEFDASSYYYAPATRRTVN